MRNWNFADELIMVPEQHANLARKTPRADYVDLVSVSVLVSRDAEALPPEAADCVTRVGCPTPEDEAAFTLIRDEVSDTLSVFS